MTTFGFLGNVGVPVSTESYVCAALETLGHDVRRVQENSTDYRLLAARFKAWGCGTVFWIRTPSFRVDADDQAQFVKDCAARGIRTVGLHLDKYWDLDRERDIHEHPWWRQDYVFTADGGNQDRFAAAGVNHFWWRPAVPASRCGRGQFRPAYAAPLAFVGSQRYHREWPWRQQLLKHMATSYRHSFRQFGRSGDRLADDQLADAYASIGIVLGDSSLVGNRGWYWSNRIPETLGRGGFLLHPATPGLEEHYADGQHLVTYPTGDCRALDEIIRHWRNEPDERRRISEAGLRRVMERDTFEVRMAEVLDVLAYDKAPLFPDESVPA